MPTNAFSRDKAYPEAFLASPAISMGKDYVVKCGVIHSFCPQQLSL